MLDVRSTRGAVAALPFLIGCVLDQTPRGDGALVPAENVLREETTLCHPGQNDCRPAAGLMIAVPLDASDPVEVTLAQPEAPPLGYQLIERTPEITLGAITAQVTVNVALSTPDPTLLQVLHSTSDGRHELLFSRFERGVLSFETSREGSYLIARYDLTAAPECSGGQRVGGTFDAASLASLQGVSEVVGDVAIADDVLDLAALSCLVRISGHLIVSTTQLSTLAGLERLRVVHGYVLLYGNDELQSMDQLTSLETVKAGLVVSSNPQLQRVALPALRTLGHLVYDGTPILASLNVNGLPRLRGVDLGALEWTTDSLKLASSGELSSDALQLDFGALRRVGGELNLDDLATLADLSAFDNLGALGGPTSIAHNPCVQDDDATALARKLASPSPIITGNGQGCALP